MKFISIVSSYRKNGNTSNIVKLFEEEIIKKAGNLNIPVEIERIQLGHYDLNFCKGCRVCFDKGEEKCPLQDDLLSIRDKILSADGIILASPVYIEDVNGIMKNWLDRMAYNNHRPGFTGKIAFLITTSGMGSSNHSIKTMQRALTAWGIHIVGQKRFRTGALMDIEQMEKQYRDEIRKIALLLIDAIIKDEVKNPTFYSLVSFKIQQKYWQKASAHIKASIDYNFWLKKGWLEERAVYYLPHNANPVKVKFARIFGNLVEMFLR